MENFLGPMPSTELIEEVREQLQKDLVDEIVELHGFPDWVKGAVCRIVEENFNKILPPEK